MGAACCTGWTGSILRDLLAYHTVHNIDTITISWKTRSGKPLPKDASRDDRLSWGPVPPGVGATPATHAARAAVRAHVRRVSGTGGIILLAADGSPGFAFNTPRMARGHWIEGMGEGKVEIEPI